MKRFFRIVFRLLILVTVSLASAFLAMSYAIHGREVAVPKFIGLTPAEADRLALASGLSIQIESRFYSAEISAGRILNQVPQPGEKVRRGWRVRAAESMGPQRVTVPNVIGQSVRAAEINLARRGLQLGTIAMVHVADAPSDVVIAQSPSSDASGVTSPKVNLVVAASDPDAEASVMPDLTGRSLDDATRIIANTGLRLGKISTVARQQPVAPDTAGTSIPAGSSLPIVFRQSPLAGQKVLPNTSVNMDVVR